MEWLEIVFWWAVGCFFAFAWWRQWSNRVGYPDEPYSWWVWGPRLWRAARASTGSVATLVFLVVAAFYYPIDSGDREDPVRLALGFVVLAAMFFAFTTAVFAWPQRLIPPALRGQPGFLAELRGARPTATPPPDQVVGRRKRPPSGSQVRRVEPAQRADVSSVHDPAILSKALVVWQRTDVPWPDFEDTLVVDEFGHDAADLLLPQMKALRDDFFSSDADRTVPGLSEMASKAAADFEARHPDISKEAVEVLANHYAYTYK